MMKSHITINIELGFNAVTYHVKIFSHIALTYGRSLRRRFMCSFNVGHRSSENESESENETSSEMLWITMMTNGSVKTVRERVFISRAKPVQEEEKIEAESQFEPKILRRNA